MADNEKDDLSRSFKHKGKYSTDKFESKAHEREITEEQKAHLKERQGGEHDELMTHIVEGAKKGVPCEMCCGLIWLLPFGIIWLVNSDQVNKLSEISSITALMGWLMILCMLVNIVFGASKKCFLTIENIHLYGMVPRVIFVAGFIISIIAAANMYDGGVKDAFYAYYERPLASSADRTAYDLELDGATDVMNVLEVMVILSLIGGCCGTCACLSGMFALGGALAAGAAHQAQAEQPNIELSRQSSLRDVAQKFAPAAKPPKNFDSLEDWKGDNCAICFKKFTEEGPEITAMTCCKNILHTECLTGWITKHKGASGHTECSCTCPICDKVVKE